MKQLHEKKVSELDGWTVGRNGYEKIDNLGSDERVSGGCIMFYDLKQWAIAVVKEINKEIKECVDADIKLLYEDGKKHVDNLFKYKKLDGIRNFLIDRFEIIEEDLCQK